MAAIAPEDDTRDFRFSIELLRRINRAFEQSDKANAQFEKVLDTYAALPGPYLATRNATLNVMIQLRQTFEEMRTIIGD